MIANVLWIAQSHFLRISGRIQEARQSPFDDLLTSSIKRSDLDVLEHSEPTTFVQDNHQTTLLLEADIHFEQGNIEENESLFPKALAKYEHALSIYKQFKQPKR